MNWLYLALNIGSIAIPLAFSFGPRIRFYRSFRFLFASIIIMASFFLGWDYIFTAIGIWEFNPDYVLGPHILNMPFEEWMFFVFIPYACVFIHESLKYYYPKTALDGHGITIARVLSLIFIAVAVIFYDRWYTFVTFSLLSAALVASVYIIKVNYLGRFFFSYLVTLIPFLLVNGFLTSMPVLIYNDLENTGFRVSTIPIEDFFYWMLLYLGNVVIYEESRKRARSGSMS